MQLLAIIAMVVAIGSVMFALQNNVPVTVTFLVWRFDSSLAMVLLMALALGGLIVALLSTPKTLRRQWQVRGQKKQISDLENTCQTLKAEIDVLRSQLPADQANPPADPPSYVGLKALLSGGNEGNR